MHHLLRRKRQSSTARHAALGVGALAGAAALHKASDKIKLLRVKKKAQRLGVGDERLDPKK